MKRQIEIQSADLVAILTVLMQRLEYLEKYPDSRDAKKLRQIVKDLLSQMDKTGTAQS